MIKYNEKKLHSLLVLLFCLTIAFSGAKVAKAESIIATVMDDADILTTEEEASLQDTCEGLLESNDTNVNIITTNNTNGLSNQVFMEDFFDAYCEDSGYGNTVLILINMNDNNRSVEIQGYEGAELYINGNRIESILDDITPYLSSSDYNLALQTFLVDVKKYMETEPEVSILSLAWFQTLIQILIALAIGGISVAVMAFNSGGKVTVNQGTYLNADHSRLLARRDIYVRTTITKTPKPKQNSGSGGGVSSGGNSHSGGGRSF